MSNRETTTYNIVLGTNGAGEIVILDDVFKYGDGFQGATGSIVQPVSQEEIERALTADEKEEWHEEIWRQDAGSTHGTTESLRDWSRSVPDEEYLDSRFEEYSSLDTEDIARAIGVEAPERYMLTSLGRIFPQALEGLTLIDSDAVRAAVKAIRAVESE